MSRPEPPYRLSTRLPESHKGTYGHCLLVGGSNGMAGAIALSGRAALRSGAGLVTVATSRQGWPVVAAFEPCYMTLALPMDREDSDFTTVQGLLADHPADVIGCGPGLGSHDTATMLAQWLYQSRTQPLVLDADGLNALATARADWKQHAGPRVLTPHPGEFRRMVDQPQAEVPELRKQAITWAGDHNVVLVLKGHQTLVTDGVAVYENKTGNPGMATGGTGDVLTGIITSLLAQGLSPWNAARLGVFVHGLAGDFAADKLGMVSLIARDLIDYLPLAFQEVIQTPRSSIGFVS